MQANNTRYNGRGTLINPPNRFEKIELEIDEPQSDDYQTEFYNDISKSIISYNTSPDLPINCFINPYRGCEHGCIYCYARPYHEYLGLSAGIDFETKIFVKKNAAQLLEKELLSPKYQPQTIGLSGATDPYQPVEKKLKITRSCLEVLAKHRNPIIIVTKNKLVVRDMDLLKELAACNAVSVMFSVTTLDNRLAKVMEPRTSRPSLRLEAICTLAENDIPVGIIIGPVIPGLNDSEIPAIVAASVKAGAKAARYIMLRLPFGTKNLFENWLQQNFPERKEKVLNRLINMRDGKLYDPTFFKRDRGEGIFAEQIENLFNVSCHRNGIYQKRFELSTKHFIKQPSAQMELFS